MWPFSGPKRSARVADESAADGYGGTDNRRRSSGLSAVIVALLAAPIEAVSCLACRYGDAAAADELHAAAEVNELMLRESMRYAIYV